jgi:hypothetical protein
MNGDADGLAAFESECVVREKHADRAIARLLACDCRRLRSEPDEL